MIDREDRLWYKDAVIYQTHVKAYFDANNDGIGDFAGLTRKLDYLKDLGITTVWVLPFYPSPLRDDGYDIADYREVNPAYGTLRDFRLFVRECHSRDLRVIIELVINHTSDQHPWFQRARAARPGSNARNFYVWSDTDQKYRGTRIIFCDTEASNWTFDPVAKAFYWHRFYAHQPDLNFDNPRVLREVLNTMRYWLDMGVDGLRLDAVPYLIEREGTNNENLPETHDILKKIRADLDAHYPDRMLLAEANQWPEDVLPYFGSGDECHMSFHFPLMPRLYMAIAQEDRHPITDIMRQTPEIPENCQWAIFLRNHDELTLEMVTDRERDYLWNYYAADRRMRINLGIRRRLAPLMENDRRKIELMKSLVLSMPGTPILYYGDEIGMGDNIYLGDRDGVRTPMQWSPDRNGGFSRADPAGLYLPPIMDPIYGFDAVNVEAQARSPSSLLNWTKRMVAVRKRHRVFGRGALRFLYPGNRKILAYLRSSPPASGDENADETILCVANMSRSAQAVELDLRAFRGRVPIELTGRSPFPPIGDLPYLLTLPGYGFFWFILTHQAALPSWHEPVPEIMPDLITLVLRDGWRNVSSGRAGQELEADVLPAFMANQRWFAGKDAGVADARITLTAEVPPAPPATGDTFLLARVDATAPGGDGRQGYFLPLALGWEESAAASGSPLLPYTLARARRGPRLGLIYDAIQDDRFALALIAAMRRADAVRASTGVVRFRPTDRLGGVEIPDGAEVRRVGAEQSNSSVLIGERMILKIYRKLTEGEHPEVEIGRFLTEVANYANTPPLLGSVEHRAEDGTPTALAILQGFVRNQGDGWGYTIDYLMRELEEARLAGSSGVKESRSRYEFYDRLMETLGQRTAELHRAFALPGGDPAFAPEPVTEADRTAWAAAARRQAEQAFTALEAAHAKAAEGGPAGVIEALLARRTECLALIESLARAIGAMVKTRIHGDYHLGQVLKAQNDFYIIDFEGEPARTLAERRAKHAPLRDIAGMVRSFDYAAWAAVRRLEEAPNRGGLAPALAWRDGATKAFLDAWRAGMVGCPSYPADENAARRLLDLFVLEKACYEIVYESANRPSWLEIPIHGVTGILDAHQRV